MITNFEEITYELTEEELAMMDIVIKVIKQADQETPIKSPNIVSAVNLRYYGKVSLNNPRLRKIINYIRSNSLLPIIATSRGYYVSYDLPTIKKQIRSLKERGSAIFSAANGLNKFLTDTENQMEFKQDLFTP